MIAVPTGACEAVTELLVSVICRLVFAKQKVDDVDILYTFEIAVDSPVH